MKHIVYFFVLPLTNYNQAILASCNANTNLVSLSDETQVGSLPPNISMFLLPPPQEQ